MLTPDQKKKIVEVMSILGSIKSDKKSKQSRLNGKMHLGKTLVSGFSKKDKGEK